MLAQDDADASTDESEATATDTDDSGAADDSSGVTRHIEAWTTALMARPFWGARSLGDWGYGASLGVGIRWEPIPISVGGEIDGIHWGSSKSSQTFDAGDPDGEVTVSHSEQTAFLNAWLRVQQVRTSLRPYGELIAGLKLINTKYSLTFPTSGDTTSTYSNTASAWTLGLGVGLDVLLARATEGVDGAVFATFGLRYLLGGRTRFESPEGAEFDMNTNTVLFSVGFAARAKLNGAQGGE